MGMIRTLLSSIRTLLRPRPVHVIDVYDRDRERHVETLVIRGPGEADAEYKRLRSLYGDRGSVTLASRFVQSGAAQDKLLTSDHTRSDLVRLLRQAQAERDRYQAEALHWETELQKVMIRLHTIEDEGRAG